MLDILIVGAGPAGLAAAAVCAQASLATAILAPTDSTAGASRPRPLQSLHPGTALLLARIGASHALTAAAEGSYSDVLTPAGPRPVSPIAGDRWTGWHADRRRFDGALLDTARGSGALLHRGLARNLERRDDGTMSVGLAGGEGPLSARWVIDCTGRSRWSSRRIKAEELAASGKLIAWTGLIPAQSGLPDGTWFDQDGEHWLWLTPVLRGHRSWTTLGRSSRVGRARSLAEKSLRGSVSGADVTWRLRRPLATSGLLVAGDAAAMLDPSCGQGVLNALHSGILAGDAVVRINRDPLLEPFILADYDRQIVDRFDSNIEQLTTLSGRALGRQPTPLAASG